MNQYKVALIGCGRIGYLLEEDPLRNKPCTHWGGASSAKIKINYACDINPQRLNQFASLAQIPPQNLYTDFKKLISEVKLDLVIIATWTDSHSKIGVFAAQSKVPVIVCEKPIAANLKDAKKFFSICKQHGTELIINHERRYDPRYLKVKEIIKNGKIGDIKSVNGFILTGGQYGKLPLSSGGGPLLHDGTHLIDIIHFLFGKIKTVYGDFTRKNRKKGFEDHALAWLTTETNLNINIEAGGLRKYFLFQLDIYGTLGKIIIGNGYQKLYLSKKSKYYKGFYDLNEGKFPKIQNKNCFKNEYDEVKKLLKREKINVISPGKAGYDALEVIHAIYFSSYKKKKILLPVKPELINLKKIFNIQK